MKEEHKTLEILENHKRNISRMGDSEPSALNISRDLNHLKINDDFSNEDQLYNEYSIDKYNGDSKLLEDLREVERKDKNNK
ncbi:hypothetical protein CM240_3059 [Clostridium bornimense]|uniref:Uncharacterized protein n=1 Tax=Clostridium bornimense TaxID=1216932 RepID=W6RZT9_9CLOT|nr:hypothetical protein [Clostridium bornimense]CDM70176.1 hypothetical protein CM240_3059 [Clostridium bornimense]